MFRFHSTRGLASLLFSFVYTTFVKYEVARILLHQNRRINLCNTSKYMENPIIFDTRNKIQLKLKYLIRSLCLKIMVL